jgi:hypothetical protein
MWHTSQFGECMCHYSMYVSSHSISRPEAAPVAPIANLGLVPSESRHRLGRLPIRRDGRTGWLECPHEVAAVTNAAVRHRSTASVEDNTMPQCVMKMWIAHV